MTSPNYKIPRYQTSSGASNIFPEEAKLPKKGFQDHPHLWYSEPGELSQDDQSQLLAYLNQLVTDLDGSDPIRWEEWGIVEDYWPGSLGSDQGRARTQDVARWRICQELRWSNPIRLAEGVEHLEWMVNDVLRNRNIDDDPVLCLYFGAALEMHGGQDSRALEMLTIPNLFRNVNDQNQLLGRACLSRLHRKFGNVDAAVAEEKAICSWIRQHPYEFVPSVALKQLHSSRETHNFIIERLGGFFDGYTEISSTEMEVQGMHIGMAVEKTVPHDIFSFRPLEANKRNKQECWVSGCRTDTDLLRCSQCKIALYCSREHQKTAWPRHKGLCKRYAQEGAMNHQA